ncbi:hypothetical protein BH09BAC6_BH09BAC6_25340 [soil metagenome]
MTIFPLFLTLTGTSSYALVTDGLLGAFYADNHELKNGVGYHTFNA